MRPDVREANEESGGAVYVGILLDRSHRVQQVIFVICGEQNCALKHFCNEGKHVMRKKMLSANNPQTEHENSIYTTRSDCILNTSESTKQLVCQQLTTQNVCKYAGFILHRFPLWVFLMASFAPGCR